MTRFVEIIFKCKCMDKERSFAVEERKEGEDIADFMNRMQVVLGVEHRKISPLCVSGKTEYVKMQLGADGSVGGRQTRGDA